MDGLGSRQDGVPGAASVAAIKLDDAKEPIGLIPASAIRAEARVLGFGAKKYSADNWRSGFTWRRLINAAMRHLWDLADGKDRDEETGELLTAHVRCEMGFLHEHMERGLGVDDRYHGPVVPASTTVGIGWSEPVANNEAAVLAGEQYPLQNQQKAAGVTISPHSLDRNARCDKCFAPLCDPRSRKFTYWYVATPYTHFPGGRQLAFEAAAYYTGSLMDLGFPVFCPITHTHPVDVHYMAGRRNHDFWMRVDEPLMDAASGLILVKADSWEKSKGMSAELVRFTSAGKPVVDWIPGESCVQQLRARMREWEAGR